MNAPIPIKEEELIEIKQKPERKFLDYIVYIIKNRKSLLWLLLALCGGGLLEDRIRIEKEIASLNEVDNITEQLNIIRDHFAGIKSSEVDEASLLVLKLHVEGKITEHECILLLERLNH